MKPIDIVIIVLAALAVIGVTAWRIIRKKQGKVGCDCGCSSCSAHKNTEDMEEVIGGCGGNCSGCSACPSSSKAKAQTGETENG